MLIGHLGVAFAAKAARKSAPLGWLAVTSFAPDIMKIAAAPFTSKYTSELVSHSIPAVCALSAIAAVAWLVRGGDRGTGALLGSMVVLHGAFDLITGCKPLLPNGPELGLLLYVRPLADLALECILMLAGWVLAMQARALPRLYARWPTPVLLCAVQVALVTALSYNTVFFVGGSQYVWVPERTGPLPRFFAKLVYPVCYTPRTARPRE